MLHQVTMGTAREEPFSGDLKPPEISAVLVLAPGSVTQGSPTLPTDKVRSENIGIGGENSYFS